MIGTEDLSIDATCEDGRTVPIFRNGTGHSKRCLRRLPAAWDFFPRNPMKRTINSHFDKLHRIFFRKYALFVETGLAFFSSLCYIVLTVKDG